MQTELIHTLILFLTGSFLVFMAMTVIRDNFANRLNRASGALLLFAGLGPLFMALGYVMAQGPEAAASDVRETTIYNLFYI